MTSSPRSSGTRKPKTDPVAERVKRLAECYLRGEKTADEVRAEALEDRDIAPLVGQGLGCNTLPQELLEAVGLDPFETETTFERPMTITRAGMLRNLRLVREGTLDPRACADWAADWFSWHIAERPDDDVVLELAGELMLGEERVEEIAHDDAVHTVCTHHLEHTPAALGERCALGLAIVEQRAALMAAIAEHRAGDLDAEGLRAAIERLLGDRLDAVPGLADDLVETVRARPRGTVEAFLAEVAKTLQAD